MVRHVNLRQPGEDEGVLPTKNEEDGLMTIARVWRGATTAEDAEAYVAYLERTGLKGYRETPGNLGAYLLWRLVEGRAEFLTLSFWESRDAIKGFAGEDIDRAVFYPEDDQYLIERELTVSHYEAVGDSPDLSWPRR
jgi:heme-degrading monooxygenase HmoA